MSVLLILLILSTCLLIPPSATSPMGNGETDVAQAGDNGRAMAESLKDRAESETKAERRPRWFWDWFGWADTDSCGANEEFTTCGSSCPRTCQNWNMVELVCPYGCVEGCFCKEGYVRNEGTGECVLPEQCPGEYLPLYYS